MNDKMRGILAILVGIFALYESWHLHQTRPGHWQVWFELVLGIVVIGLGIWRLRRNPKSKLDELLK